MEKVPETTEKNVYSATVEGIFCRYLLSSFDL
jgi:hypothetical protein